MKKAVVFDFDGVIIDSLDVQKQAFTESYKMVVGGGVPPIGEFMRYSGDSLKNIFSKMNLPFGMIEQYRRISQEKNELVKVFPGIRILLNQLTEDGYRCGLCTGKDSFRTLQLLQKLNLKGYFKTVVCSDKVKNPKPHAESLVLAAKNLGVGLKDTIMIGDSCNDIICAQNAGTRSIGVTWGVTSKKGLATERPDDIVSSMQGLYDSIVALSETALNFKGMSTIQASNI